MGISDLNWVKCRPPTPAEFAAMVYDEHPRVSAIWPSLCSGNRERDSHYAIRDTLGERPEIVVVVKR